MLVGFPQSLPNLQLSTTEDGSSVASKQEMPYYMTPLP
jgi:hypothetical protein